MNLRKQLSSYIALNNYVEAFRENTSSIVLTDAITNGLTDLQLKGGTEQGLLPDTYQLYTSVEANGVTYEYSSQNLTQIPCKRIADNVFGLYNYTTKVFISEV